MKKYLTIDIGGSAIKYGVIDEQLNFTSKGKVATPLDTIENLLQTIGELVSNCKEPLAGLAVSMPGIIDNEQGYAYTGGALSYIHEINFKDELEAYTEMKVAICNDAKAATLAEMGYGHLEGIANGIVVVLGTGIGGGVVINNKLIKGTNFSAGEFSFIKGDVNDDSQDNLFAFTNGIGGVKKEIFKASGLENIEGVEAFKLIKAGNKEVLAGMEAFCDKLAFHIYNLQVVLDVQRILIGGGISQEPMMIELINEAADRKFGGKFNFIKKPEIMTCQFCNDANLIGALYNFKNIHE
ncbi:MAG: ROK family protein [Erysipelotrichaceae bacterium]|nr:ROK family protein [Erysipelotrichaceae bacterium]MDD3809266.1 ROK family protein [Erysipelotrichaceae bacterium]